MSLMESNSGGASRGAERAGGERSGVVCWASRVRSEVEVLYWGPDRGNPTSMRQGRGPELTGRPAGGCLRGRVSVRAGLEEAVGVSWSRTRVKRRKASFGWAEQLSHAPSGSEPSDVRLPETLILDTGSGRDWARRRPVSSHRLRNDRL